MTRAEQVLVDGALLSVDSPYGIDGAVTSQALFAVPDERRRMIRNGPAGHSHLLEEWHRTGEFGEWSVHDIREVPLDDGVLRLGLVSQQTGAGLVRELVIGYWETINGYVALSSSGRTQDYLEHVFRRMPLRSRNGGAYLDQAPIIDSRPPAAALYVEALGTLIVQPLTESVLRQIPSEPGMTTPYGDLYRVQTSSQDLLLVTDTCRVGIATSPGQIPDLDAARGLNVQWTRNAA